ncbi:MAG: protein jag [Clostridia bacterium]|nr:protein jag [Clostridia bacterium]
MEEKDVFYGKTVEEAIEAGLLSLGIDKEQAEITVLEEGKKKIIGGVKAKVKVVKKVSDGNRAVEFIEGLLEILKLNAVTELVSDGDKIEINLTSTESSRIIGRHGEVLDSIQTMASAVANIGRDDYKRVVVDCEEYRAGREKTLTELAHRLEKKAVERQRRVTLEPMNPYERRIIHSALAESEDVKTISSGKEPARFVVIIPNNEKPYEGRGDRHFGDRGDRKGRGDRRSFDRDKRPRDEKRGGAPRGKKEIHFGTFLGNSGNNGEE